MSFKLIFLEMESSSWPCVDPLTSHCITPLIPGVGQICWASLIEIWREPLASSGPTHPLIVKTGLVFEGRKVQKRLMVIKCWLTCSTSQMICLSCVREYTWHTALLTILFLIMLATERPAFAYINILIGTLNFQYRF